MKWIKRQWKKISAVIVTAACGAGLYYNGQQVEVTPTTGRHLLTPDFTTVATPIFSLDSGERYISISLIIDRATGKVKRATADTLDTDIDIAILKKFIQCRK